MKIVVLLTLLFTLVSANDSFTIVEKTIPHSSSVSSSSSQTSGIVSVSRTPPNEGNSYFSHISLTKLRVSNGPKTFNVMTNTWTGGGSRRHYHFAVNDQVATRVSFTADNLAKHIAPESEAMAELKRYKTRRILTPVLVTTSAVTLVIGLMSGNGESTGESKYGYIPESDEWGYYDEKEEYDASAGAPLYVISGISAVAALYTGTSKNAHLKRAVELHNMSLSRSGNFSAGIRYSAEF